MSSSYPRYDNSLTATCHGNVVIVLQDDIKLVTERKVKADVSTNNK